MIKSLLAVSIIAASVGLASPVLASDIDISISIGQPDFYGRIDTGDYPQPRVIYYRPVLIEQVTERPPIYMRVPPGHAKHWAKHCREYNACGERVYFVQDDWYTQEYAPRYREQHRDHRNDSDDDRRDKQGDKHGKGKHGNNNH